MSLICNFCKIEQVEKWEYQVVISVVFLPVLELNLIQVWSRSNTQISKWKKTIKTCGKRKNLSWNCSLVKHQNWIRMQICKYLRFGKRLLWLGMTTEEEHECPKHFPSKWVALMLEVVSCILVLAWVSLLIQQSPSYPTETEKQNERRTFLLPFFFL